MMVRKTKAEAARTRRRILDAALAVFLEKGFARASLQEIAARAGFTRGAVYWHFTNKVDLLVSLADDVEHGDVRVFDLELETLDDLAALLATYLRRFAVDEPFGRFYRTVVLQTAWTEEVRPLLDWYRTYQAEYLCWLERSVAKLQAAGEFTRRLPAATLALSIAAFTGGLVSLWLTDADDMDMSGTAPELLTDFLEGMRP